MQDIGDAQLSLGKYQVSMLHIYTCYTINNYTINACYTLQERGGIGLGGVLVLNAFLLQ